MRRLAPLSALALALVLLSLTGLALPSPAAAAQEEPAPPAEEGAEGSAAEAPEPLLSLESVAVRPAGEGRSLGPETLARLVVKLVNRGGKIASNLVFEVTVAGQELPVYHNQVFLKAVPAGETVELPLYNFWTSETGRPAPADGKLEVKVTLTEARWVERTEEEDVEVWTPVGEVDGLPSAATATVELKSTS